MDISKMLLTGNVAPPAVLEQAKNIDAASERKKEQLAKDFESVFISKIVDQMSKSVGDWGLEKDAASKQTEGIFWLYLARDMADNGGFGLWKDIKEFLDTNDQKYAQAESLDKNI
ncbi:hypothetical protein ACFL3G_07520 [Planctomycetota bacterium]